MSEITLSKNNYPAPLGQEIDLLVLLSHLLKAKKLIIVITLIFMLIGVGFVNMKPKKWTSEAIITPPEQAQLVPLHDILANMQALDVEVKETRLDVYNYFIKEFASRSLFQKWLLTSPPVLRDLIDDNADASQMHRAIVEISDKLKVSNNLDPKHPNDRPFQSWTLSFTGSDPEKAQQLLSDYIQYVVTCVRKDLLDTLNHQLSFRIDVDKKKLALKIDDLENERDSKIQRLKYALKIAKAAGIKKPIYGEGLSAKDDPDYSVTLGADGLAEKLEVEKSLTDVASISADLRNREYKIAQLSHLVIPKADFMPFRFQLLPSLPIKHDGPGNLLIILLFTILGTILASISVLFSQVYGNRK